MRLILKRYKMTTKSNTTKDNEAINYEPLLCPVNLFRYFIRKQYENVEISNEECDGLSVEFAKYLTKLQLTDEQKKNILPKSEIDVIMNNEHPLKMNGFEPAYVFHFAEFIEKMKKEVVANGA